MSDNKIHRRNFLQLATTGVAGAAIPASATAGEAASTSARSGPRPGNIFAYGYQEGPYKLPPGPHLFIDWRYVYPGLVGWKSEGKDAALFAYDEVENITGTPFKVPYGIKLVPQAAEKIGPILTNDREWEFLFSCATVLDLGGKYGLWYEVVPPKNQGMSSLLCYAESTDGVTWKKPELGLFEFNGSKANNIIFSSAQCPYKNFHGDSVFLDPNAPAAERFKVIFWSKNVPKETLARLKAENPESVTSYGTREEACMLLGTSPDGFKWTFSDKPLYSHVGDTQTCVDYDPFLKRYVLLSRTFGLGRRAICRSETADITRWPAPELCLWSPNDGDPSDDLYLNSKSLYPGTQTMHLAFVTLYRRRADTTAVRIASSMDSALWNWLPGEVLQPGVPGDWDGGGVFALRGLMEIPGDRVVLPYTGYVYPHKYPRFGHVGQYGLASWTKERIVAMQADEDGEFWTPELLLPPDKKLYLNFDVKRAGYIRVELEGVNGRKQADCDLMFGNALKRQVTWKGNASFGVENGKPTSLRFRMRSAKLFSFEVK